MAVSPHVRPTPAAGQRNHAGEPATVAFRRPADGLAAATLEQRWDVPVVLRLPDLNAPAGPAAAPLATNRNPLVGKLMWVATGVLAIVAIWLVASGNPDKPKSLPAAPAWNSTAPAAVTSEPASNASALQPVPNWKTPHDAEPVNNRGPWRAGAQVIQPGATSEAELGAADRPTPPGSASWPGDAWPGGRPDADRGREPAAVPPATAPPANGNFRELPLDGSPPADPATAPSDPWPGDPQWPDDARNGAAGNSADLRTARRPASAGGNPPGQQPQARLQGGIQNMDANPSYDGTRSSIH